MPNASRRVPDFTDDLNSIVQDGKAIAELESHS